jgi:hypothetical protein
VKSARNIAVIGALLWIIFKMIVFNLGLSAEWYPILVMTNMLAMLIVIFLSLHFSPKVSLEETTSDDSLDSTLKPEPVEFLSQFKTAMKSGATYTVLIFLFLLAYYSGIDKDFTEVKKKQAVELAQNMDFEGISAKDPVKMAHYSHDDAVAEQIKTAEWIYSPFFICTLALIGMIVSCAIYSLIATVFYRKVLLRLR